MGRIVLKVYGQHVKVRIKYNENEKVIVAIADGCERLALGAFHRKFTSINSMYFKTESLLYSKLLMKNTYACVAKCHKDDEFSFHVGKCIAIDKLKAKLEEKVHNRMVTLSKELKETAERLMEV